MRTLPWLCSMGGSPPRDFTSTRPQYSPSAAPAGMATITRTTCRCPGWSTMRRGKMRRNEVSDGSPLAALSTMSTRRTPAVSDTGYPNAIESSISSGREPHPTEARPGPPLPGARPSRARPRERVARRVGVRSAAAEESTLAESRAGVIDQKRYAGGVVSGARGCRCDGRSAEDEQHRSIVAELDPIHLPWVETRQRVAAGGEESGVAGGKRQWNPVAGGGLHRGRQHQSDVDRSIPSEGDHGTSGDVGHRHCLA